MPWDVVTALELRIAGHHTCRSWLATGYRDLGPPGGRVTDGDCFGAGGLESAAHFNAVAVKDEKPIGGRLRIFESHFDKPLSTRRNDFIQIVGDIVFDFNW